MEMEMEMEMYLYMYMYMFRYMEACLNVAYMHIKSKLHHVKYTHS